jgi:hypothetical protein
VQAGDSADRLAVHFFWKWLKDRATGAQPSFNVHNWDSHVEGSHRNRQCRGCIAMY